MRCYPHSTRALTLIEVVASLALLGTLLVSIVLAQGRYVRQAALAQRKLEAVEAADELLEQWTQSDEGIPTAGEGELDRAMIWQTEGLPTSVLDDIGVQQVRLTISTTREPGRPVTLTQVELLIPKEEIDASNR